jgi:hypothetical protein
LRHLLYCRGLRLSLLFFDSVFVKRRLNTHFPHSKSPPSRSITLGGGWCSAKVVHRPARVQNDNYPNYP